MRKVLAYVLDCSAEPLREELAKRVNKINRRYVKTIYIYKNGAGGSLGLRREEKKEKKKRG